MKYLENNQLDIRVILIGCEKFQKPRYLRKRKGKRNVEND